eukprot:144504_1
MGKWESSPRKSEWVEEGNFTEFQTLKPSEDIIIFKIRSTLSFFRQQDLMFFGVFITCCCVQTQICRIANRILFMFITSIPLVFTIVSMWARIKEESILVIQDMGVQLEKIYFSGRKQKLFIEKSRIQSVIITEGITMCRVIFYISFIVHERKDLVLGFQNLFPRLPTLVKIFQGTEKVLFGVPTKCIDGKLSVFGVSTNKNIKHEEDNKPHTL